MPDIAQVRDLTVNTGRWGQGPTDSFRAVPGNVYAPGILCKMNTQDLALGSDIETVIPTGLTATEVGVRGIVSQDFGSFGFDGIGTTTLAGSSANIRGTQTVKLVIEGPAYGLIDQSGTGAATISNTAVMLVASRATAGYMQGSGTASIGLTAAYATLPASNLAGVAVSLVAGALTQGSNTTTIAGTPAALDTITVTFQVPYNYANPGVAQTQSVTITLTAGTAASATTAAAALVAALNGNATYAKYYVASNVAGVVTHTAAGALFAANGAYSNPFLITYTAGGGIQISPSGFMFNGATLASAATGGSTAVTAGNIAAGAGYKGILPVFVAVP